MILVRARTRVKDLCRRLPYDLCLCRYVSTQLQPSVNDVKFHQVTQDLRDEILKNFLLFPDFINQAEETSLLKEIEPKMRRMRYQYDHWDDAIHGFRETEQIKWNQENAMILDRVRSTAFPSNDNLLPHVHVLDLAENGWIKPHIDSVKFCGNTITGISLLSDSVMRLERESDGTTFVALLKRRSLYIMKGLVRYEFKHSILKNEESFFGDEKIEKVRRVSVICRNEPESLDDSS